MCSGLDMVRFLMKCHDGFAAPPTLLLQIRLDRLASFRPALWWSTIIVQGLRTVSKQNDLKEPIHGVNGIQELIILSLENDAFKELLIHVLDWYSRMFVSQRKFGSNVRCCFFE